MLCAMTTPTLRKAAVFLDALPDEQAASLLARMLPEQAAAVSGEMAGLPKVESEERESVIREFVAAGSSLATETPCETIAFPNAEPRRDENASPFRFLHDFKTEDLVALFRDEQPQTIALVFSQLPACLAADGLALFPANKQTAIFARIAAMREPPNLEIVRDVARAVERRLNGPAVVPMAKGMAAVAKMFGAMRPATERKLLGGIAKSDPDLFQDIRRAMFGPDVAAAG